MWRCLECRLFDVNEITMAPSHLHASSRLHTFRNWSNSQNTDLGLTRRVDFDWWHWLWPTAALTLTGGCSSSLVKCLSKWNPNLIFIGVWEAWARVFSLVFGFIWINVCVDPNVVLFSFDPKFWFLHHHPSRNGWISRKFRINKVPPAMKQCLEQKPILIQFVLIVVFLHHHINHKIQLHLHQESLC